MGWLHADGTEWQPLRRWRRRFAARGRKAAAAPIRRIARPQTSSRCAGRSASLPGPADLGSRVLEEAACRN